MTWETVFCVHGKIKFNTIEGENYVEYKYSYVGFRDLK